MNYKEKWEEGMSYDDYRGLVQQLLSEGKSTAPNHDESLVKYSELNNHRMSRLDKTFDPTGFDLEPFETMKSKKVMVLTEGWCGDAAQSVPVLQKMMSSLGVEVRYFLRDHHLDLMDQHLTNGGRSIPVVLFLNEAFGVEASWGPRPSELQDIIMAHKNAPEPKPPYSEVSKQTQLWYTKDKQKSLMKEWAEIAGRL